MIEEVFDSRDSQSSARQGKTSGAPDINPPFLGDEVYDSDHSDSLDSEDNWTRSRVFLGTSGRITTCLSCTYDKSKGIIF